MNFFANSSAFPPQSLTSKCHEFNHEYYDENITKNDGLLGEGGIGHDLMHDLTFDSIA